MINIVSNSIKEAQFALNCLAENQDTLETIVEAAETIWRAFVNKRKMYTCGNGGSMCDAMHFAEELTGRFRENRQSLPAMAISDPSHMSCVSNDFGYEFVFSRFIESFGHPGDIFFPISTSGASKNCLKAAEIARSQKMTVIALVGKEDSPLSLLSDITICTPGHTKWADRTQELHIKCIHILMELIEHLSRGQNSER